MNPLTSAEREALVAKVVANGLFDSDDARGMADDDLVWAETVKRDPPVIEPYAGHVNSDELREAITSITNNSGVIEQLLKSLAFPPGTKFFVKGFDVPVAVPPTGKAASWFGGHKGPDWSDERLLFVLYKSNEGLSPVSFGEFVKVVAESLNQEGQT
jgi:hypothetical protein